jgi:HAE1 family hydrophobic/amphiphilic exporter-1
VSRFFINRPIVAMVISIITVIVGLVTLFGLPISKFPNIVPPEVYISANYIGADALTLEQSVAAPIEEKMSGVDNMNYIYSLNANNGSMRLFVNFDVATDPNTDHMLTQLRYAQAESLLPLDVRDQGVTVQKSLSSPFMFVSLFSPKGTHPASFMANYAYINMVDYLSQVPGISQVNVFGAGQYAMRLWVKPDLLAKLNITVPEIINAVSAQNTVNPAGRLGGNPVPAGQEFTFSVVAQGRLVTEDQFGQIVVRANPDGSIVRVKDVARVELGGQDYDIIGRYGGKPAANLSLYQLPGSNALKAAQEVKARLEELKKRFPADIDYAISLDATLAITEGMHEIMITFMAALTLVTLVVFIFLQGWRATLIPLLAVPVSLVGTFAVFPLLGFSINTLSLFGLVLAVGLVVDDAIVVVECVERHIEEGSTPKEAALKAMGEVSGPVVAIALILAAVFIPTIFIPGITGRLYQQFAVTIAISVLISAFNALSLSPALSALILRPRTKSGGPLGGFYDWFNRVYGRVTHGYVGFSAVLIRKSAFSLFFLLLVALAVAVVGRGLPGRFLPAEGHGRLADGVRGLVKGLPGGFLPEEDQGYIYVLASLPYAASEERTSAVARQCEEILSKTPGIKCYTTVIGFSLLSGVRNTYSAFFWVSLEPWDERTKLSWFPWPHRTHPEQDYAAIRAHLNKELAKIPGANAFVVTPPAIQGVGAAGGFTFILEDRAGKDIQFLNNNLNKFLAAARKRPELANLSTTFLPVVPQAYVDVDRDKVLKQGVDLGEVYLTLQAYMGGAFVNYFNRFGRQWQVYVEAEGQYRTRAEDLSLFYVRNRDGQPVPLSSLATIRMQSGPEFTLRYDLYRSAQINGAAAPGYSSGQANKALEEVFEQTMPPEMGYGYLGMSFQEKQAQKGVQPVAVFSLSLLFVFLILAALYESWSLPFSVLLGTPIAVFGAFAALWARSLDNNVYAQIGLVMLIGLAAKNAILIVEFARIEYTKGKTLTDAALTGARIRLRPILMTSFAFVFGCIPLWIASGAGAEARRILGTVVIGGMLAATCIAIFLIPVTFYVVEKFSLRFKKHPAPPGSEGEAE